jgi:hypothetical protein
MSNKANFKNYRAELVRVTEAHQTDEPPIMPYLGIYLRDLTFIEEGNASCIVTFTPRPAYRIDTDPNKKSHINFAKIHMCGSVLFEVQRYQHQNVLVMPAVDENPLIFNYLSNLTIMDDDTLYERTLSTGKARKTLMFS